MIPIGRGQRELIIGDRQTSKTAIAIDTIINQKDSGISVSMWQSDKHQPLNVVHKLEEHNALENTIVVVASASDGCFAISSTLFRLCDGRIHRDRGEDALIVYDDLSASGCLPANLPQTSTGS